MRAYKELTSYQPERLKENKAYTALDALKAEFPEKYGSIDPESKFRGGGMISKDNLLKMRARLNTLADEILVSKGNDYNAAQQEAGDTLFNLRVCALMGIVPSPVDGILVRMSDKLMRLVSLTRPGTVQRVTDESLEDTVIDLRNYADYVLAMVKEQKGEEIK